MHCGIPLPSRIEFSCRRNWLWHKTIQNKHSNVIATGINCETWHNFAAVCAGKGSLLYFVGHRKWKNWVFRTREKWEWRSSTRREHGETIELNWLMVTPYGRRSQASKALLVYGSTHGDTLFTLRWLSHDYLLSSPSSKRFKEICFTRRLIFIESCLRHFDWIYLRQRSALKINNRQISNDRLSVLEKKWSGFAVTNDQGNFIFLGTFSSSTLKEKCLETENL